MTAPERVVGLIGLGNMGGNIAQVLRRSGYSLVLYNREKERYEQFKEKEGVYLAKDLKDFVRQVRAAGGGARIWLMIPGGKATNETVSVLSGLLSNGDLVIDGSNSIYVDSVANYDKLRAKGIQYLDVGCAGGPEDVLSGVALMVGGDMEAFEEAEDILKAVAGKGSYGYLGGSGSGHMAKLVHNGIFYGIFPVYAEGVELLARMRDEQPEMNFDMDEALRLLQSSPPVTTGIMKAISSSLKTGRTAKADKAKAPEQAPEVKISEMVRWEAEKAKEMGVDLSVTNAILEGYGTMSEGSRRIYSDAKKKLTGH